MKKAWCALILVLSISVCASAYDLLTVRIDSQDDRLFEKLVRLGEVGHHFMFRPYSRGEILGIAKILESSTDPFTRSLASRLSNDLGVEDFNWFRVNPLSGAFFGGAFSDDRQINYEFQQYVLLGGFFAVEVAERCEALLDADFSDNKWAEFNFSELMARLGFWKLALSAGRGEMWWGEGRWGTLLLSNNAGALDHIGFWTDRAVGLGPFGSLKFAAMIARLEEDRYIPEPLLLGMGASWLFDPFELGVLRTIMFGGEGRPYPKSAADWADMLLARSEHTWGRGLDTNQLLEFCGRLSVPEVRGWLPPLRYFGIYFEYGAESIMDGLPASIAHVLGVELDFGRTDLRLEYAETENPSPWYEHYVYKSGYTYKGEVIGHHIGCCSRGGEFEINRYLSESLVVRLRSEVKRYQRRDFVATDISQGLGVWGMWRHLRFDLGFSVGREGERMGSDVEETAWYGSGNLSLGLALP